MFQKTLIDKVLSRLEQGGLSVTYWDGEVRQYGQPSNLKVVIKNPKVGRRLLKNPNLAVGEAYMKDELEVQGPLDKLSDLYFNNASLFGLLNKGGIKLNKNIKSNQARLVSYHYDLGNNFYKLWLDNETLGYTCGYYKTKRDTLEQGQIQKFDHILKKLQLKRGMSLLDIGFGWGYLLVRAAKLYKVKGLGVSLSQEQLKYARALAKKHKVSHLVQFKLMNYQDLPALGKQFDRIVSIGFMEHVGQHNHAIYFKTLQQLLRPDGVSVLHCITSQTESDPEPFVDKYIFPGGYIPSVREITALMPNYGFRMFDYENIGPHYVPTLQEWWKRFEANKEQVIKMYDERFYRMWRWWLAGSISAFRSGAIDLSQWTFTNGDLAKLPLTREHLYK